MPRCRAPPPPCGWSPSPRNRGEDLSVRHDRHGAAVLGPGAFVGAEGFGALLAVADHRHSRRIDPSRGEVILGGIGSAVAECEIIFASAALVAMALDRHAHVA